MACALAVAVSFIISLILDNQRYKDEKGYGISQKIAICFQEDSIIVSERELWRGKRKEWRGLSFPSTKLAT